MGNLNEGKPVAVGHWDAKMCASGLPVPLVAMADRRTFHVAKTSDVVLTLVAPAPLSLDGRSSGMSMAIQAIKSRNSVEGTTLQDTKGHEIKLEAASAPASGKPPGGWPTKAAVALVLPAGWYRTLAWHGYCSGTFTLTLDKLQPTKPTPSIPPKSSAKVKSVKAKVTSLKLKVKGKKAVDVTVRPAEASGAKLTWTSNKPKIAKVTSKGVIKALAPGKAIIKVKAATGKGAKINVTVRSKR